MMNEHEVRFNCEWMSDGFDCRCTCDISPYCAEWCPVVEHPEICICAKLTKICI